MIASLKTSVKIAFEGLLISGHHIPEHNCVKLFTRSASNMNYMRFLNQISSSRKPSPLRELTKLITLSPEPIINLGTGFPNTNLYPFESISVTLKDGGKIDFDSKTLPELLQYGPSDGYSKLLQLLREYQTILHKPPLQGEWSVAITSGSQDAMCKSFEMLISPGDYIISEEYIYPGAAAILKPYGVKHLSVEGDNDGIRPDSLREVLKRWDSKDIKNKTQGVPKVLYTIPNGSNPVGTSISTERRRQIYKIAQEYDLLILEDDPYYFLHFGEQLPPSFLSMDVDGRVLRFDSFSKLFSGGVRAGFVTGPQPLVQRIVLHMQVSIVHASHLPQMILYQLLEKWGYDKYISHGKMVAQFYKSRRDMMIKYATKWLAGLAEWNVPAAGMFLWIKILGVKDTQRLVSNRCLSKKVAFLPGRVCTINDQDCPYIRASFSYPNETEMDSGFQSLAEAIKEEINSAKSA